jgi:hypothetical protein
MNNRITIGLITTCFIWLTACHKQPSKSITENSTIDSTLAVVSPSIADSASDTSPDDSEPLKVKELEFEYLVAKSKVSFKSKNQDFDNTNVNIRMKRDSTIWISVTGVGLEVARGLITPDSIVFMDKIHRDYFVFNYEQLSKQYNFDLNFALLQSVIIGNLPFEQADDSRFVKENDFYVLKQVKDSLEIDNYVAESTLKLSRLKATEVPTQNTFTLDYGDFKDVNNFLFPFLSVINLNVKSAKDQKVSETNMRIKHSKVELVNEDPGFPFKVPSGYKRKR